MLNTAPSWDEKLCRKAESYAREAFGLELHLHPRVKAGLPRFITEQHALFQGDIFGRPVVFMAPRPGAETGDIVRQRDLVRRQMDVDLVVLLFERLSSRRRNRMIAQRIAFMVPQSQTFVPELMLDLRESKLSISESRAPSQPLSPTAQVVILGSLLRYDVNGANATELAQRFGLSPMSLSRAFDELALAGLAILTPVGRRKELHLHFAGKSLWDATERKLRSPVRKVRRVIIPHPEQFPARVAGESALALLTMLANPRVQHLAAAAADWNRFVREFGIETADPFDQNADEVETWSYDPGALTHDRVVDPLSLYLSLRHHRDERVAQAAEHLLETFPW